MTPVLEAEALREARRLAELMPGEDDLAVHHLLGWFHWFRHQALAVGTDPAPGRDRYEDQGEDTYGDQGRPDLRIAVQALTACFLAGDENLPDPLVPVLAENAAGYALQLLSDAQESDDPARLSGLANLWQRIVEAVPAGHPHRAVHLTALGNVLRIKWRRGGPAADLDTAIDRFREALSAVAEEPGRAMYLYNLGDALNARFDRAGAVEDLEDAVALLGEALRTTPDEGLYRALVLTGLGSALRARYERAGALPDLDGAIARYREAVPLFPLDQPGRTEILSNLGNVLRLRFERTGDTGDLDSAVEVGRQAAEATPEGHPGRAVFLSNLGIALQARFVRAGLAVDVDAAVEVGLRAVEAAAAGRPDRPGRPDLAMCLSNLGGGLWARYQRFGVLADLNAAIDRLREAVQAVPADHPQRARYLSNLGNMLRGRFARVHDIGDLDSAIEAGRQAVDAAPATHLDRAMFLSNLGAALQVRFGRLGVLGDLDASIVRHRQAVEAVQADHPLRARYLSNLVPALRTRFGRSGVRSDLDDAITAGRQAVESVPADHPERAVYLNNLGGALVVRFDHGGDPADRDEAVRAWSAASTTVPSSPFVRIDAGLSAALLLARSGEAERAAQAADAAVRLMPQMTGRRLERQDQQDAIGDVAGLAGTAAALALAAPGGTARARAERALGLLEVGRAVMLGQALENRSDLTDLYERSPELAARFAELRDLLDRPADASVGDRHRPAEEFTAVLAEIRALDGFASFALPPTVDELRAEASHGPIVVFNVSTYRSDALLLTAEGLTGLPLPGLDHTTLVDRINAFRQAQHTALSGADPVEREEAQTVLVDVLEWLWDAAAGPVLEALGHKGPPPPETEGELPRVWWAPGGLLGLLPLHAAGHHTDGQDDPNRRTVMDRVVSSYTPTVRALRHARERGRALGPGGAAAAGRALIVAMPTTPGLPGEGRLRFVDAEAALLEACFPDRVLLRERGRDQDRDRAEEDAAPTKANVLAHLPHCAIAHFACHGTSDPADPSRSRLLLHDHADDPFTVRSLAPVALDHARLAYLSACRTAAIDTVNLLDEAIHLTSAFQLAGFPHVIGTLWEIDDQIAVRIARAFYDGLRTDSGAVDPDRSARALHAAVRQVRDGHDLPPGYDRGRAPLLWAAHLHAGA
ncbi:CHAT domain-containing protein [Streptomyces sp. NPDC059355]|uniref:CHAT domain-containing tetratricopeptide repeat protein n=1 Tax=Streptomyces sp. NPDC059355 TaxID=3346811 RepID=UPI003677A651